MAVGVAGQGEASLDNTGLMVPGGDDDAGEIDDLDDSSHTSAHTGCTTTAVTSSRVDSAPPAPAAVVTLATPQKKKKASWMLLALLFWCGMGTFARTEVFVLQTRYFTVCAGYGKDYFPYSHAALFMPPILFLYLETKIAPILIARFGARMYAMGRILAATVSTVVVLLVFAAQFSPGRDSHPSAAGFYVGLIVIGWGASATYEVVTAMVSALSSSSFAAFFVGTYSAAIIFGPVNIATGELCDGDVAMGHAVAWQLGTSAILVVIVGVAFQLAAAFVYGVGRHLWPTRGGRGRQGREWWIPTDHSQPRRRQGRRRGPRPRGEFNRRRAGDERGANGSQRRAASGAHVYAVVQVVLEASARALHQHGDQHCSHWRVRPTWRHCSLALLRVLLGYSRWGDLYAVEETQGTRHERCALRGGGALPLSCDDSSSLVQPRAAVRRRDPHGKRAVDHSRRMVLHNDVDQGECDRRRQQGDAHHLLCRDECRDCDRRRYERERKVARVAERAATARVHILLFDCACACLFVCVRQRVRKSVERPGGMTMYASRILGGFHVAGFFTGPGALSNWSSK
eukprot:m.328031 g.328031  ORF g.328031 m.328031 type:complete len:570 (-) comp27685_c0_seq20:41-1750(-)